MQIVSPILFLLATLSHGVDGRAEFTTLIRSSKLPLITRVSSHDALAENAMLKKPRCNRLEICPKADGQQTFEAEETDADTTPEKLKFPKIFDNCMSTCHLDYPQLKPEQDCCNYCDEFMGCCPSGDDHLVPFMCTSEHRPFPAGSKVGPDPYANLTTHFRNQSESIIDWITVCLGEWWDQPNCVDPVDPDDWYLTKRADKAYYLDRWRAMFTDHYMLYEVEVWPQREAVLKEMRKMWEDDERSAGRKAPYHENKWEELVRTKFPGDEEIMEKWCKPSNFCARKS